MMDTTRRLAFTRLCCWVVVIAASLGWFCASPAKAQQHKPSILFINVDDLNDWNEVLGGHPQALTPNIKRLAQKGVTFTRAICASPVCFPSRTSLFTGMHPTVTGAISNFNWGRPWRFYAGDAITLPKHLESHGWRTFGAGKNFHDRNGPEFQEYFARPAEAKSVSGSGYARGPVGWAIADASTEEMPDHRVVSWGIERIKTTSESMFLSVGIYKPHVPWILPKECFDKYPLNSFQLPDARENDLSDLAPRLRLLAHNEAKFGTGFHQQLEQDDQVKLWARAYMAAVTFADQQLGRLLDAWEASEHSKNGIVVLWSDHGFMLGEKEGWCKFKPWYDAIHSNLIICGSGIPQNGKCDKAVSLLDIYPTLISQLGVEAPTNQSLDGNDLTPLLQKPDLTWNRPVVLSHEEDGIRYDVVMDNRYRMTRLITGETELYDLEADPHEWTNLAADDDHAATIQELERHLTFRVPTISGDTMLEAETTPCQTSADFRRRGNFHYWRKNAKASGGEYLCVELTQGVDSYVDFVVEIDQPGTYRIEADFGMVTHEGELAVSIADVTTEASQATAAYSTEELGPPLSFSKTTRFQSRPLGTIEVDKRGLKLLRLQLLTPKPVVLRIDKIRFIRTKVDQ